MHTWLAHTHCQAFDKCSSCLVPKQINNNNVDLTTREPISQYSIIRAWILSLWRGWRRANLLLNQAEIEPWFEDVIVAKASSTGRILSNGKNQRRCTTTTTYHWCVNFPIRFRSVDCLSTILSDSMVLRHVMTKNHCWTWSLTRSFLSLFASTNKIE